MWGGADNETTLPALFTHRIVTYTQDYAENSPFLKKYLGKVQIIPPPVELPVISQQAIDDFRQKHNADNFTPVIGMAARFATEKGGGSFNRCFTCDLKDLSSSSGFYSPDLIKILLARNNTTGESCRLLRNIRTMDIGNSWGI